MCECSSIMPHVRCRFEASIILTFSFVIYSKGFKRVPIATIFPLSIITSVLLIIPCFSLVHTVAFLNKTGCATGKLLKPLDLFGSQTSGIFL